MVGIQGQTKDMIRYDIDCLKRYFKLGTVNVYNNNTTPIRRDQALVDWFMDEYQWLMEDPAVEVLYEITEDVYKRQGSARLYSRSDLNLCGKRKRIWELGQIIPIYILKKMGN